MYGKFALSNVLSPRLPLLLYLSFNNEISLYFFSLTVYIDCVLFRATHSSIRDIT